MLSTDKFKNLNTPCLLLDEQKVKSNVQRMRDLANKHNVVLRPHLKTAKSRQVADLFNLNESGEKSKITVSTPREAEYFADAGYKDILLAVGIEPGKFPRISKLVRKGINIIVVLDTLEVARLLNDFAKLENMSISVMVEIDTDGHRAGIRPEDPQLPEITSFLSSATGIHFSGLMTHAGGSYHCHSEEKIQAHANQEQVRIRNAADVSQCNGTPYLSIGSTPTVLAARDFEAINEIRPGVFVFYDLFQQQLGLCSMEDLALSVLTSVVGHKQELNRIIVDAGALALSKDRSTSESHTDYRYGLVTDIDGQPFSTDIVVNEVNQEHGVIDLPSDYSCIDFPIGRRLRVLPNHACMTAAAYEGYTVFNRDSATLDYWPRCNGW